MQSEPLENGWVECQSGHVMAVGTGPVETEIIEFCRGNIATFRVPRYVRFVDEWPMSGTKIKKFELRQRIADELSAHGITEAANVRSS